MLKEFLDEARVVNCQKSPFDVYIGRPSEFGNPFTHIKNRETIAQFVVKNREEAIKKYEEWILQQHEILDKIDSLKGKVLGCWCAPKACHGEILVRLVNLKIQHEHVSSSELAEIYRKTYFHEHQSR